MGWAVILGASEGTGAAIARAVARDPGLDVFAVHRGRHPASAEALEQDLRAAGRSVAMRAFDAGSAEGAESGAAQLLEAAGPRSVQLFVHSITGASLGHFTGADEGRLSPRQIHRTFDALAHSFVFWARELDQRGLLAPGARLLGLTNPLGESLIQKCGLIASAKAALETYVRCLAMELGPRGYRVNLLKFSTVVTPAVRTVYGAEAMEQIDAVHRRMIPAGRMCTVDEVGRLVSTLCGESTAWFNGATIDFTGGMTLGLADLLLGDGASAPR